MKKIIAKWILISLGIGMIAVVMLGASQGGIALSPLILLLVLVIGVMGAATHANIYAYKSGTKKQKMQATIFGGISAVIVGFLIYSESRCELKQEYAEKKANSYVSSKLQLNIKHLGGAVFDPENCVYTFEYASSIKRFTIYVAEYGELHFSSH